MVHFSVKIPNWHVGASLTIKGIEAKAKDEALEKAVASVNRYAGYHYCDELPPGTTVQWEGD